jgi:prolyl-tRNA synthetase
MGCYGIGTTRVLGTLVEVYHDERGLRWPLPVAPYHIHLMPLLGKDLQTRKELEARSQAIYDLFVREGYEVLLDDRFDLSSGERFAESDLLGIPVRIIISERNHANKKAEIVKRAGGEPILASYDSLSDTIQNLFPWERHI